MLWHVVPLSSSPSSSSLPSLPPFLLLLLLQLVLVLLLPLPAKGGIGRDKLTETILQTLLLLLLLVG